MSRARDDDLAALLDDLRATLDELERTLADDRSGRRSDRAGSRPDGRRRARDPPRGREVLRFTEEYTIPTVISVLETTIRSLELLRGVLRLADPGRDLGTVGGDRPLGGVEERVADGAERALADLRRVLSGTEEPTDPAARDVYREARELTAEIESRLAEAGDGTTPSGSRSTDRRRRGGGGVRIPVDAESATDDGRGGDAEAETARDADPTDGPDGRVDVEAELDSIREEVRAASDDGSEAAESGRGTDAEDGAEDGAEEG